MQMLIILASLIIGLIFGYGYGYFLGFLRGLRVEKEDRPEIEEIVKAFQKPRLQVGLSPRERLEQKRLNEEELPKPDIVGTLQNRSKE